MATQVPEFLLCNVHGSRDARLALITDLQLFSLWQYVNGDKPYDHSAAIRLQSELRAQHAARLRLEADKRRKKLEETEKNRLELCRKIAEEFFTVEVDGDEIEPTGQIRFDNKIRDLKTGKLIDTPRNLLMSLGIQWRHNFFDASDLERYLTELKSAYDGFEHRFTFDRDLFRSYLPKIAFERAPFEPKPPKHCRFDVRLSWKPFSQREIIKKVKKLISKSK